MKKNSYYISLVILCVLCSISHGQQVEIESNGDDRSFLINLPSDTNDPVPLVLFYMDLEKQVHFGMVLHLTLPAKEL